ncbi:hypothetical protein OAA67_00030 [Winogradskyella sp.]|nr:hypothetical protein [Winogradskyella sp.]
MVKLCLYRIKASTPEFACKKVDELLNPPINSKQFSQETIENIKKTSAFEFLVEDEEEEEVLHGLLHPGIFDRHDLREELLDNGFMNSVIEVEKGYHLMNYENQLQYSIVGCLSDKNECYTIGDSKNHHWKVSDYTIASLNEYLNDEDVNFIEDNYFSDFDVLEDSNTVRPDLYLNSITVRELRYHGEKLLGQTFIVFAEINLDDNLFF